MTGTCRYSLVEIYFRGFKDLTQQRCCKTAHQLLTKNQYGLKKIVTQVCQYFSNRGAIFDLRTRPRGPELTRALCGMTVKFSLCWWFCQQLRGDPSECRPSAIYRDWLHSSSPLSISSCLGCSLPNLSSAVCSRRVYVMRSFITFNKHKDI